MFDNTDSMTNLFNAVIGGQLTTVKKIINKEISRQTFQNLQCTLLHQAANNQHCDVLQYLLDNHAYVDCRDANRTTPLMVASHKGDYGSVRLLLRYGADVNAVDYDCRTPLYFAAYDGYMDCLNTILQDENLDTSIVRNGGWSALHEAARFGHVEITKALIECGLDITAQTDDASWTPAHMAASSGRVECLKLLIDAGIDVDIRGGPNKSSTLLHEACHHGHNECIQLLLQSGADPSLYDGLELPHHLACMYNHADTLDIMLNYFREINRDSLVDAFTNTDPKVDSLNYNNAFHMASYYGRKECLDVLLKHNAKNICNGIGRTPEILAVCKLHVDCLKLLIADLRNKVGMIDERRRSVENKLNPLYYLCQNSYKTTEKTIACACLLLNSGLVDVNQHNQNEYHQLCLETAVQNGSVGLVRYLLLSGADPYMCHVTKTSVKNQNVIMCCDFVEEAQTEPRSLLECSRTKIRESLLCNGMHLAYTLPLPRQLKDYIYHGHYKIKGLCDV